MGEIIGYALASFLLGLGAGGYFAVAALAKESKRALVSFLRIHSKKQPFMVINMANVKPSDLPLPISLNAIADCLESYRKGEKWPTLRLDK